MTPGVWLHARGRHSGVRRLCCELLHSQDTVRGSLMRLMLTLRLHINHCGLRISQASELSRNHLEPFLMNNLLTSRSTPTLLILDSAGLDKACLCHVCIGLATQFWSFPMARLEA
eukprot:315245-Amphidinium_carterae.1